MRIYWSLPLPGPFRISETIWHSKPRKHHITHNRGLIMRAGDIDNLKDALISNHLSLKYFNSLSHRNQIKFIKQHTEIDTATIR